MPTLQRTSWSRSALAAAALVVAVAVLAASLGLVQAQDAKDKPPPKDPPPVKDAPPKDKPPMKEPPFKVDTEVLNKPIKREELQRKMAEEASDPVFKLTRLDRVYFAYREEMGAMLLELRFEGVCLAPDFNDAAKQDMLLRQKLGDLFYQVYPDVKDRFDKRDKKDQPSISIGGIKAVKIAEAPTRQLQELAGASKELDGTLFSGASFNAEGQLVLEGLIGTETQRALAEKLVEKLAADKPSWLRPEMVKPGKQWVLNMPAWDPIALLQGELAAAAGLDAPVKNLTQQTLVRRVHFAYEGDPVQLKCWVEAVCLTANFNKDDDARKLRDVMLRASKSAWDRLKGVNKFRFDIDATLPTTKITPVVSPIYRLQQMANRLPELDGSLIERAVFDKNGTLRIEGFINQKDHVKKIEEFVKELESGGPEWLRTSDARKEPRWITQLRPFPIALKPAAFQSRLSESKLLAHRQTRVDRIHFDYDDTTLVCRFYGVSLWPEWPKEEEPLSRFLSEQLKAGWLAETNADTKPALGLATIKPIAEDPVPRLQQTAGLDPKLDGLLFVAAEYNAEAILRFPVYALKPAHGESARGFVAGIRRDHPVFRPGTGDAPWILEVRAAGPALQPMLQERLAVSTGFKENRQLRLDRVWFSYVGLDIRKLELHCQGISIGAGQAPAPGKEPRPRAEVAEKVQLEVASSWGIFKAPPRPGDPPPMPKPDDPPAKPEPARPNKLDTIPLTANLDDIDVVGQPGPEVQSRIAKAEPLDGVRLYRSDDAKRFEGEFDKVGKLILRGQWRDAKQEKALRELLTRYFEVRPPRIDLNGLILNMDVFRTDEVLLDLQRYAADRLEDVLLLRLFFDEKGQVKLQGSIANEDDAAELKKVLEDRLKKQPTSDLGWRRGTLVASARLLPALIGQLEPPETPGLDLPVRKGLTAHLRALLQASTGPLNAPPAERWDGVLITRGFYDSRGNFVLQGLVSQERQRHLIEVLLQELAPSEWRPYLPNSWSLEGLRLLPIDPMLSRLRVVMPAYPELDGLTLQRAFHDVRGQLILRYSRIGPLDRKAEATLKTLLDSHPEWKVRSAAGVRLQLSGRAEPRDPRVLEETLLKAVQNLRYDRVDDALALISTAILHDTEDSTAWYVRALCYLLKGEQEQAERDLRRTVLLEKEGVRYPGPRANLRLERLELLQTKTREKVNDVKLKVLNDVESGKPPLALGRTP